MYPKMRSNRRPRIVTEQAARFNGRGWVHDQRLHADVAQRQGGTMIADFLDFGGLIIPIVFVIALLAYSVRVLREYEREHARELARVKRVA